jgi:hypothetical protein
MAAELIGGREYYTDALQLTSGTTNCVGKGRIKGVFNTAAASHTFHFPSATITFIPDANSIIPFAPLGVTFASGSDYGLY